MINNATKEEIVEVFELWTAEFKQSGDTTNTEVGTKEHDVECANYFIELLNKVRLYKISEIDILSKMQLMCESSLDPESFEKWEQVKKVLYNTRRELKK